MMKPIISKKPLLLSGLIFALAALILSFQNFSLVEELPVALDLSVHRTGALAPTEEELKILQQRKVVDVVPNLIGLRRLNLELSLRGLLEVDLHKAAETLEEELQINNASDEPEDPEFAGGASATSSSPASSTATTSPPSKVDNSTLASFPPIGNQGGESSCVAWATTYYQMSHEYCLSRKCSNKSLNSSGIYSPKWTYNLINFGNDYGSSWVAAYEVLAKNGAVPLTLLPYKSGDYRSWDLNSSHWRSAIYTRTNPVSTVAGLDSAAGLNNAKKLLNNGHVLTAATYIGSWVYFKVGAGSPFTNQSIAGYESGSSGSHMITIVGYDDAVWVDLNKNGRVDSGEKGAFKIANSWGAGWGNAGYMWVSYDALKTKSAVSGGPAPSDRQSIFYQSSAYLLTSPTAYTPKMIAQFTLNAKLRNQVQVTVGSNATSETRSAKEYVSGAFQIAGGPYGFNGSTNAVDGTFYLDVTPVIRSGNAKYFLVIKDLVSGNPTVIKSFNLIDVTHGKTIAYGSVPQTIDHNYYTAGLPITYNYSGTTPAPTPTPKPTPTPTATPKPTPTPTPKPTASPTPKPTATPTPTPTPTPTTPAGYCPQATKTWSTNTGYCSATVPQAKFGTKVMVYDNAADPFKGSVEYNCNSPGEWYFTAGTEKCSQ